MRFLKFTIAPVALLMLLVVAGSIHAATMQIVNDDRSGEGLNDDTPATPVGGNVGTTLGRQRRIALQFAADLLGARIGSSVPIRIRARFDNLQCSATTASLAQSGPAQLANAFAGQTRANTLYPLALANALAGRRIAANTNDINATFNATIDRGSNNCLQGRRWYYGLDDRQPPGRINFVNTAAHELIHGLGFVSQVVLRGPAMGQFPRSGNRRLPDIFSRFIRDLSFPNDPFWPQLTAAQRADSIVNGPNVVWGDINTGSRAATVLDDGLNGGFIQLFAPDPVQLGSSISHWDPGLSPDQVMEPFATDDNDITEGIGLASCVLEDIGWQLINNTRCPDTSGQRITDDNAPPVGDESNPVTGPATMSAPTNDAPQRSADDDDGGGGCTLDPDARFDPLFGVLLMLALATLYSRRRRRVG